jgi:ribonucleoside-diphosphate reductase beta chain
MKYVYDAANWSDTDDHFTQMFYEQNTNQFWLPEEVSLNGDLLSWESLTVQEKEVYKKALAGLTLLDTEQGDVGMPTIMNHIKGHQRKALLNFMGAMENIHAKSYSNIFLTLASAEEIRDLFYWIEENKELQYKAATVVSVYESIQNDDEISLYKGLVASVLLETFLFYSGFYYPLLFFGQGKLMQSGQIIKLIIRDESIHGVYVGLLAQEIYNKQNTEVKTQLDTFVKSLFDDLYQNELLYTESLYDPVGLSHDVKKFLRYNGNKAMQNLGFDPIFAEEEINPIVLNGLNTSAESHDYFSMKGSAYKKAKAEAIQTEDFYFE